MQHETNPTNLSDVICFFGTPKSVLRHVGSLDGYEPDPEQLAFIQKRASCRGEENSWEALVFRRIPEKD